MKKTEKTFDAVAESRRWREETSRMLDAMELPARLAYLESLRTRPHASYRTAQTGAENNAASVREESP